MIFGITHIARQKPERSQTRFDFIRNSQTEKERTYYCRNSNRHRFCCTFDGIRSCISSTTYVDERMADLQDLMNEFNK